MANRLEISLQNKNGGNQSELARFVGVSPQAVQKWVSGETVPKGNNLTKAAEFLGVSPAYLQFGTLDTVAPATLRKDPLQGQLDPDVMTGIIAVLRELTPELQRLALAQVQNVGLVAGVRAGRNTTDNTQ